MSLEQIRQTVEGFVTSKDNDFLIMKGSWGVGKTFFWSSIIRQAQNNGKFGKQFYSYVSLFGVNTLEELKQAVFAGMAGSLLTSKGTKAPGWFGRVQGSFSEAGNTLTDISKNVPFLKDLPAGLVSTALFMALQNTLVCLDDIERRGNQLDIKDILGLVSFLKEQRECKVALIVNEDALSSDEVTDFRRHSEKVADIEVRFAPTSEEAVGYVFTEQRPYIDLIRSCCLRLNIKNIRTIQRVNKFYLRLLPYMEYSDKEAVASILKMLVLYVWAYYDKESNPPPFSYMKDFTIFQAALLRQGGNASDDEQHWSRLLGEYGYEDLGEISKHLMHFVESGYTDLAAFSVELQKQEQLSRIKRVRNLHDKIWDLYNTSFEDNETELVEALEQSFRENLDSLSINNLQNAVSLFRDLGHDELANKLIDEYLAFHHLVFEAEREMNALMFLGGVKDGYLRERIQAIHQMAKNNITLHEAVSKIAAGRWSEADSKVVSDASTEEIYSLFKAERSQNLYYFITACLNNSGPDARRKTKQALRQISSESRLNRVRIQNMYGVNLDED